MKILIFTDLEGVTGVFKFRQTREFDTPEFREAMLLLMGDIAAVAEGLREGGATEIIAVDGHDGGNNFPPAGMVSGVRYLTGLPRDLGEAGLATNCAGVVLLGYHAMNGTPDGVLHHTQSSAAECKYWYDDIERGEIYQSAVVAGHYDVPVILVTGDEAACREARATLGEHLPTVAVKKGLGREAAFLLAPEDARALLREGGKQAMAALPNLQPYKPDFPVRMRLRSINAPEAPLEHPWYADRECEVRCGLDIVSGSRS